MTMLNIRTGANSTFLPSYYNENLKYHFKQDYLFPAFLVLICFFLFKLPSENKQTNTEKNIALHQEQMYPLHELLTQLHKLKIYAHEMCTRNKIYKRRAFLLSQLKLLTK